MRIILTDKGDGRKYEVITNDDPATLSAPQAGIERKPCKNEDDFYDVCIQMVTTEDITLLICCLANHDGKTLIDYLRFKHFVSALMEAQKSPEEQQQYFRAILLSAKGCVDFFQNLRQILLNAPATIQIDFFMNREQLSFIINTFAHNGYLIENIMWILPEEKRWEFLTTTIGIEGLKSILSNPNQPTGNSLDQLNAILRLLTPEKRLELVSQMGNIVALLHLDGADLSLIHYNTLSAFFHALDKTNIFTYLSSADGKALVTQIQATLPKDPKLLTTIFASLHNLSAQEKFSLLQLIGEKSLVFDQYIKIATDLLSIQSISTFISSKLPPWLELLEAIIPHYGDDYGYPTPKKDRECEHLYNLRLLQQSLRINFDPTIDPCKIEFWKDGGRLQDLVNLIRFWALPQIIDFTAQLLQPSHSYLLTMLKVTPKEDIPLLSDLLLAKEPPLSSIQNLMRRCIVNICVCTQNEGNLSVRVSGGFFGKTINITYQQELDTTLALLNLLQQDAIRLGDLEKLQKTHPTLQKEYNTQSRSIMQEIATHFLALPERPRSELEETGNPKP